jgi:precorrin-2 methylase
VPRATEAPSLELVLKRNSTERLKREKSPLGMLDELPASAGVPYEVVPGLSTLTALPALAGIPLTSRGVSAEVTVVTGTSVEAGELAVERAA